MDKTGFERFDGYGIEQVVERKLNVGTDDGYYICEPCQDVGRARLQADYRSDFWTLYGHLPSGGGIAIGIFKTEEIGRSL